MKKIEIPRIKTRIEVKNEASGDDAKLFLYGNIASRSSFWDEETITSKNVKRKLDKIDSKNIHVHINSGGGDVFESIAIHNNLKQHKAKIIVHIDALAASGASVIAMAADKIIMPKNTMMMIHKAWTFTAGNSDELRKTADDLEKMDSSVLESYKSKFVGTEEELMELIKNETWLTAEECKAFGFCDELEDEIEIPEDDEQENQNNISAKERILAKYTGASNSVKDEDTESKKEETGVKNNINTLAAFLNSFK